MRGTNRQDVRKKLDGYLEMHNRAALLEGVPVWDKRDLITPFIHAFPIEVTRVLQAELAASKEVENSFQVIYRKGPMEDARADEPESLLSCLQDASSIPSGLQNSRRGIKRPISQADYILGRLAAIVGDANPNKRPRTDEKCRNCGMSCRLRGTCPAKGKECRACHKLGHFAKVCRSAGQGGGSGANSTPTGYGGTQPKQYTASLLCAANTDNSLLPIRIGSADLVEALVDSGATRSYIDSAYATQLGLPRLRCAPGEAVSQGARRTESQVYAPRGYVEARWALGPVQGTWKFYCLDDASTPVILGVDFQREHRLIPVACEGRALLGAKRLSLPFLPEAGRSGKLQAVRIASDAEQLALELDTEGLAPSERQALLKITLPKYFASASRPFGRATSMEHRVDTGESRPICLPLRPTSPAERQIVCEEVAKMLEAGAIRPFTSPWASPIVLVRKKDGSIRFCVDYRKLNDVTVKDKHPLPRISDMLEALHGAKYFTSLDAASGYWQIPMEVSAIPKTALICSEGLFEWTVMPFGLTNAPATYQRVMNQLLAGLLWKKCLVYPDDVLIYSKSFEAHLRDVKEVMNRLCDAGFLLKAKKCTFAKPKTIFLGHQISAEEVSMDPKKIEKVKSFPRPTNPTEVRAFLGLVGYYRKFIKGFAELAAPLRRAGCPASPAHGARSSLRVAS